MKRIGIVSFFPAFFPPRSGGELRLHHIARQLARRGFEIEMVSPTLGEAERETIEHCENFREKRFPKTRLYDKTHRLMDLAARFPECSGLVCSLVSRYHGELRHEAARLARSVDILTQESPFLAPLIPKRRPRKQLYVYNSYNVETVMARDMFGRSPQGRAATAWVRRLEKRLLSGSDLVQGCSQADLDYFHREFGMERARMLLVPNGVDVEETRPCPGEGQRTIARERLKLSQARSACFFLGSYHPPNIEAVDLIAHRLALAFPEVDFLIAGKVCEAFGQRPLPDNVRLLGLINEEEKQSLLWGCDAALNPVATGSGTNLKILEYLAAGLPVLTTPHGARGLGIEDRRHALVAEAELLPDALEELLGDDVLRGLLAREGRELVENQYSWSAIGEAVADLYDLKLSGRRIIILNDYSVYPAEQGGQVRVEAVARRLADSGVNVSILTLSSGSEGRRIQINKNLEELNVPRSTTHRQLDAVISHAVGCSADDTTALLLTKWLTPRYTELFRREVRHADGVMLSHPYMEPISRRLPKRVKLYFDSHNTEYDLKQKLYKQRPFSRYLIRKVKDAEINACRRSEAVFCVSDENRQQLAELVPSLNGRSYICPNGVDCSKAEVLSHEERRKLRREIGFGREFVAIFLGSGHPPNKEAASLIIDKISREHPRVLFLLVGSVSGWFWNRYLPGNVLLMGMVSTPVKDFLLKTSDFALNPMMTGSGTSLKLFDYLAAGLPVLSTRIGARGLDEEALKSIVLLDPDEFSRELRRLLSDPRRCEELSHRAREFAEKSFDWSVTLSPMEDVIAHESEPGHSGAPQQ